MRIFRRAAAALTIASTTAIGSTVGAHAAPAQVGNEESPFGSTTISAEDSQNIEAGLLEERAALTKEQKANFVPIHPDDVKTTISSGEGIEVTISHPRPVDAFSLRTQSKSRSTFGNGDPSATEVQTHDDGTVEFTTTIEGKDSAEMFEYEVGLPPGAYLEKAGGGAVTVLSSERDLIGLVLPPSAIDSQGHEVATDFKVEGTTLIQKVEHRDQEVSYPLTTTSTFGAELYSTASMSFSPEGWIINATPTFAGRWYSGPSFHDIHLQELVSKFHFSYRWMITPSIEQQFFCHIHMTNVEAIFGDREYNMESWRPYVHYLDQAPICNPT